MGTKLPLGCCRKSGMGVKTPVGLEFCLVASPACKAPKSGRELSVVLSPKKNGVDDAKIGAGNCIDSETHRRTEAKDIPCSETHYYRQQYNVSSLRQKLADHQYSVCRRKRLQYCETYRRGQ